jgi:hypothetical protein
LDYGQLQLALDLPDQHLGRDSLAAVETSMLIFDPPYLLRRGFKDGLKIDYVGFSLLALGLGSLEVVLDEGQREDLFSSHFIVTFALIMAVWLISVVFWELRYKQPVIDFRVLKERNYMLATVSMLVQGFVLYGSTTLPPMFLQSLLGYTALLSGLVLSPGGIVICALMPLVGFLIRRYEARWLVVLGVPRNIGGSSGIATVTTLLARRAQYHQAVLVSHLTPYDQAYRDTVGKVAAVFTANGAGSVDAANQATGLV